MLPRFRRQHGRRKYFHIHENEKLDEEQLASWIKQAAGLPGDALF
jgi:hypothetical protein